MSRWGLYEVYLDKVVYGELGGVGVYCFGIYDCEKYGPGGAEA